ncbi:MAG: hypothetical protein M1812_003610 [Candelaria pacifica]|nr:MAG: hypothetical protein M1812_003610 [Candelaria pacifica]
MSRESLQGFKLFFPGSEVSSRANSPKPLSRQLSSNSEKKDPEVAYKYRVGDTVYRSDGVGYRVIGVRTHAGEPEYTLEGDPNDPRPSLADEDDLSSLAPIFKINDLVEWQGRGSTLYNNGPGSVCRIRRDSRSRYWYSLQDRDRLEYLPGEFLEKRLRAWQPPVQEGG